jgi:hypothetical protein
VDRLLRATGVTSILAGGWAVWRHGYVGRVTEDVDIVLPADGVEEFLRAAQVSGFEMLTQPAGHWPKLAHKETSVTVDILPEGGRPGTESRPAPTTIRHPRDMGPAATTLCYIELPALIELKLAAGRVRDEADVVELLRANPDQAQTIRAHLATIHANYVADFDRLAARAREQRDQ